MKRQRCFDCNDEPVRVRCCTHDHPCLRYSYRRRRHRTRRGTGRGVFPQGRVSASQGRNRISRRKAGTTGLFEKIALVVALCLCAPFAALSFQLAAGLSPLFKSAVPFEGPVLIAIYGFTLILVIAVIGDSRVVLDGGISGAPRIARHLWRMCLGLTLAMGSAFTNGLARLLSGPYHVPPIFFLPQFLPLGLLIFWLIRLRFAGWRQS